ncbi:MAG TPA: c-type cytochrome [Mucilaginibacter sp.]|jgi:cytochrome c|nr:c-type cytochrome [Mucilaginibacter sp.]
MKRVFVALCISAAISACGGSSKTGTADSTNAANQTAKQSESSTDTNANKTGNEPSGTTSPGAKLLAANDCLTCHKVDVKVIGPAYQDVAAKYPATEANIDTLANKVIRGGKGNWGDVPMTAHPTISQSDAKDMVKYILSLKK